MKSTVTDKGQITIPKPLRDRLGLRPGTVIEFEEVGGRLVGRKLVPADQLDDLVGILELPEGVDAFVRATRGPGPRAAKRPRLVAEVPRTDTYVSPAATRDTVARVDSVTIRDLRNRGGEVADRVAAGEHLMVTRDGRPVAELRPIRRQAMSARALLDRCRHLPAVDPDRLRRDIDAVIDQRL